MSLYVYCLCEALSDASFEGVVGVCGAAVRLLSLGRLSAVVSEIEDEHVALTDENVLAHNRVNTAALAVSTPLPFRFGTRAARERLIEYAAANETALVTALGRVRGRVEMTVKIMLNAKGKRQKAKGESEEGASESEGVGASLEPSGTLSEPSGMSLEHSSPSLEPSGVSSESGAGVVGVRGGRGTAFLLAKRREMLGEEGSRRRAEELAAWLAAGVAGLARETDARINPSEAIVLRAAHLVERERVAEYRERVRSLGAERPGLRFLTSGPWPPYSFSDIGGTMNAER